MCCPEGVKLAVRSLEAAAELLNNPKLKDMKVFWGDIHNHCNVTYGHGDLEDALPRPANSWISAP